MTFSKNAENTIKVNNKTNFSNKLLFTNSFDLINISLKRREVNFYSSKKTNQFLGKSFLLPKPKKNAGLYYYVNNGLTKTKTQVNKPHLLSTKLFSIKRHHNPQTTRQVHTDILFDTQPFKKPLYPSKRLKSLFIPRTKKNKPYIDQMLIKSIKKKYFQRTNTSTKLSLKTNKLPTKHNRVVLRKKIDSYIRKHNIKLPISPTTLADELRKSKLTLKYVNKLLEKSKKTSFYKVNLTNYSHPVVLPKKSLPKFTINQFITRALYDHNTRYTLKNS